MIYSFHSSLQEICQSKNQFTLSPSLKTLQNFPLHSGWNFHHLQSRRGSSRPRPCLPLWSSPARSSSLLCSSHMDLLSVSKTASGPLHLLVPLPRMLFLKTAWFPSIWPSVLKNSPLFHHRLYPLLFSSNHAWLPEISCFFFVGITHIPQSEWRLPEGRAFVSPSSNVSLTLPQCLF